MKRKIIQLYSALIYNAYLKGFITGEIYRGSTKFLCVPGLNCYSCPAAVGACPLGALQNALISLNYRVSYYVLGIILLYGVILGRTVCGWLCPIGLIQELLYKFPTLKIAKSGFTRALSYLKYFVLAYFVILVPVSFCKYICPAGTLGALGLLLNPSNSDMLGMLGEIFALKFGVMIFLAFACVFVYRAFCRFICPLGAVYGLFNRFNILGVKVDENLCVNCGRCVKFCKMDVKFIGDRECINCGECEKVCLNRAVSFKFGNIANRACINSGKCEKVDSNRAVSFKFGNIANRACRNSVTFNIVRKYSALVLLLFALFWYNLPEPAKIQTGHEVGQRLENFSIKCLDGSEFTLSQNLGKIVIINLWATYCDPCIRELPFFDSIYRTHKNELEIIAVHSSLVIESPAEFLEKYDFTIKFAVDTDNNLVWDIVNGSSALPQTIVLNRNGEIIYNQRGSLTPGKLDLLYMEADNYEVHKDARL